MVNRLAWEVKTFYPLVSTRSAPAVLTRLRERVAVDLPEEEAANIAFHVSERQKWHRNPRTTLMRCC